MKFCKTAASEAERLNVEPFPYKRMKRMIKLQQRDAFVATLCDDVARISRRWERSAHRVLCMSAIVRSRQLRHSAERLVGSANLYSEATRKIIKKYNKHADARLDREFRFHFQTALTIKRLLGVCGKCSDHDCCICLDTLFHVRAQLCGHFVCRACFERNIVACPICRNTTEWFKAREIEHCLQKNSCYHERLNRYMCNKYDTKKSHMPLISLLRV